MQTHQNNFIRIQELRKTSASLDAQIRDTLSSLASTRKDIVTTPTTTFPPGPNHPFSYEELLSYARRISKTTMPPASTLRASAAAAAAAAGAPSEGQTPLPDSAQATTAAPSAAATPSQPQSPAVLNGLQAGSQPPPTQQTNTSMPPDLSNFLNPQSGQLFFPWPQEDKIRSGSLAAIQILADQGINPKGYDPVEEEARKQREAELQREQEEKARLDREEKERHMMQERERLRIEAVKQREKDQEAMRKAGAGDVIPSSATKEKKQFQFSSLDDLDDDDDDD